VSHIGNWIAVRGRATGRRIKVTEVTEDGTVKFRYPYNGGNQTSKMSLEALVKLYERDPE